MNYANGAPTLISEHKSISSVTVFPEANGRTVLFVAVRNQSNANANLGTENVRAESKGKALRVFTYEELAKKAKSAANWQRFAAGAAGGLRAGAAAQPAQSNYGGTFNGNGYGGPYSGNFRGYATTTDPAMQAMAQSAIINDSRQQGAMLNAKEAQQLAALQRNLRTTTVQPGQVYGGIVETARPPASSAMTVQVNFAGEKHSFEFQATR